MTNLRTVSISTSAYSEENILINTTLSDEKIKKVIQPMYTMEQIRINNGESDFCFSNSDYMEALSKRYSNDIVQIVEIEHISIGADTTSNNQQIEAVESMVKSKNGPYFTIEEYKKLDEILNSNHNDLFNIDGFNLEFNMNVMPENLDSILDGAEMYYGFNENEAKALLEKVNQIGYTFNYVDVATRDNGQMNHTVILFALRKID